jgi:hypothetical protein
MLGVLLFAGAAVAAHGDPFIDLTFADATVEHNGAVFIQGGVGAGTGNYDPFLQVQETGSGDGVQKGYNTEPAANGEFDTKGISPGNTHSLRVSAVPVQTFEGSEYREFSLDSNDTGSDSFMSIDEIKIFVDDQFALTDYNETSETFGNDVGTAASKIWDLDGDGDQTILAQTQALEPGSGVSDITVLVPADVFPEDCDYGSEECDLYLIFWTVNGEYVDPEDPRDFDADSGFEEWRTRLLPVVNVTKDTEQSFARDFSWTIIKTADPTSADLFAGETQTFDYDVTVTQTVTDGAFTSTGTVTISNPTGGDIIETEIDAVITDVTDLLDTIGPVPLDCPDITSFPYELGAGESIVCTYELTDPAFDEEFNETNTATVTIETDVGGLTDYFGTDQVDFTSVTPTETGFPDINVTDTNPGAGPWATSSTMTFEYSLDQTCSSDAADYTNGFYTFDVDNTAEITETGQQDDETVTVSCYAPVVTKDAEGSFGIDHTWTITKVDDADYERFAGESVIHPYTVSVDLTETEGNFSVTGSISVTNPAGSPGNMVVGLSDELNDAGTTPGAISGCTDGTWDAGDQTVEVAPGDTAVCSYEASPLDDSATENTVTATFGDFQDTASDDVEWSSTDTGFADINITDTNPGAGPWTANADDSFQYNRTFDCPTDPAVYEDGVWVMDTVVNTAEITETGQSDTATVNLTCYAPILTKDAETSFTRDWAWTIDKVGDQTAVTLEIGETAMVNYDVTVNATSADSDWAVEGTITVQNPHPSALMTVSLVDVVDGVTAALDCGGTLMIPAASSDTCDYSADLTDGTNRTNTVTATLNSTDFTADAAVTFSSDPTSETDECIDVSDTIAGALGTVCADQAPFLIEYQLTVGPYQVCGQFTFENVASFVTNDNQETGSDDHIVDVDVPCPTGCTLTLGYWQTHSSQGPAPFDDTWDQLANGADTPFFLSGGSWLEAIQTNPQGNAYWILAQQYVAAQLNFLTGAAAPPEVVTAFNDATALFAASTPAAIGELKGNDPLRQAFIAAADVLASYNEGDIGPGHCDEVTPIEPVQEASTLPLAVTGLSIALMAAAAHKGRYARKDLLME